MFASLNNTNAKPWVWAAAAAAGVAAAGLSYAYLSSSYAASSSSSSSSSSSASAPDAASAKSDGLARGFFAKPSSSVSAGAGAEADNPSPAATPRGGASGRGFASDGLSAAQESAEAARKAGNEAFNSKDYAGAVDKYTEAISLGPAPGSLHVCYTNRAFAHLKLEQPHLALIDTCSALAAKPDASKAFYMAGLAYNRMGLPHRAVESFAASEEHASAKTKPEVVKQKDAAATAAAAMDDAAVAAAEAACYAQRDELIAQAIAQAEDAMTGPDKGSDDYKAAVSLLVRAIHLGELDAHNPAGLVDAHKLLGRVHFLSKKFKAAADQFTATLAAVAALADDPQAGGSGPEAEAVARHHARVTQEAQFFLAQATRALGGDKDTIIELYNAAIEGPDDALVASASNELIKLYKTFLAAQPDGSDAALEYQALITSLGGDA